MKKWTRTGLSAGVGLAIGAVALLSACGSSPSSTTTSDQGTGFQAYLSCLQSNGVTLPSGTGQGFGPGAGASPGARPSDFPSARPSDGQGGGFPGGGGGGGLFGTAAPDGVDQATWTKAIAACASVRPTGGPNGGANNSAFVAYRNCLSEHGVTQTSGPVDTADPAYVAADKACAALRPSGRPRASGSSAS
jgi:hypothetical protein